MSELIRTFSPAGWGQVNRRAVDDERLSIGARGVLAWLLTRPDDHRIHIEHCLSRWRISQPTWARIRLELEAAGYLRVEKRKESGRFVWTFFLTDTPAIT